MKDDQSARSDPLNDLVTEPLEPTVRDGAVVLIGPVALAMIVNAAKIPALRLLDAATKARERY